MAARQKGVFFLVIARGSRVGDHACVVHDRLVGLYIKFLQSEA